MNKYTKLKIEYEKQKEYNIQLNLNLRNYKKRGTSTPNHTNIINNDKNCKFKTSHFSLNFHNKNNNNKVSQKKNEIKK